MVQPANLRDRDDLTFGRRLNATWYFFVRESVDDLLGGPFGVGIRGNVEVNPLPPIVTEHDEDVEDTEGHGRNREEVTGGDVGNMIV